jgi:hypothetical protein
VLLRYRDLLKVENLFLRTKAVMANAADLPFLRRCDTLPRLLFFPSADHAENTWKTCRAGPEHVRCLPGDALATIDGESARARWVKASVSRAMTLTRSSGIGTFET